ncbi:hypothetical protein [Tateyamaria sp. SN3-11]|uniref:hypothetical protein n=1 Tax=Tateyamaria sp. SN3-11 TaxID=3092147 RepID=UPI0039ED436A
MTSPSDWASLQGQLECAACLYGADGAHRVAAWFTQEEGRVDDPDFARLFSDHISLPGIVPLDFAHRHVNTRKGSLIGGIRFYGQDVARPFVEVIAHDFEDVQALAQVVAGEWRAFAPQRLRLQVTPGTPLPQAAALDMSLYAARYRDLCAPSQQVQLGAFDTAEQAMDLVEQRFEVMAQQDPNLRRNVSPITTDALNEMWQAGQVHKITAAGQGTVGLIAIAPGQIGWVEGDEVIEEVVAIDHAGHGYAAAAQYALSAVNSHKLHTYLIGTIDGLNVASRRSAERVGRKRIMDYAFLPLDLSP